MDTDRLLQVRGARWVAGATLLACSASAQAVFFSFNYDFDSAPGASNFFDPSTADGLAARNILEAVGSFYAARLNDQLTAIDSDVDVGGTNNFTAEFFNPDTGPLFDPGTGTVTRSISGLDLAAGEIMIIPGARDLPGGALATAGPWIRNNSSVAFNVTGDPAFVENALTRGQGSVADVDGPGGDGFRGLGRDADHRYDDELAFRIGTSGWTAPELTIS